MESRTIMIIAIVGLVVVALIAFIITLKHSKYAIFFSGLTFFISIGIAVLIYSISAIDEQKQGSETFERFDLTDEKIEKTFSKSLKESVDSEDIYISKDDIFYIDIVARKNENEPWQRFIEADIGSTIELCIKYENTTSEKTENNMVLASLPDNMEYVDESATLFNESNPKGLAYEDPCVASVNIGSYKKYGNAQLRFKATITDTNLEKGRNVLHVWAKISETKTDEDNHEKRNALLQVARVYVEKQ